MMTTELNLSPTPWTLVEVNKRLCPADAKHHSLLTIVEDGEAEFAVFWHDDDAKLLLVAPDLLEACLALPDFDIENPDAADFKDHCGEFMRAMRLARAAFAKLDELNK